MIQPWGLFLVYFFFEKRFSNILGIGRAAARRTALKLPRTIRAGPNKEENHSRSLSGRGFKGVQKHANRTRQSPQPQGMKTVKWISRDLRFPKSEISREKFRESTKCVPVKLAVQPFVLFVVIAGERGVEESNCVPKDNRTLYHGCKVSSKVVAGPVNPLLLLFVVVVSLLIQLNTRA